MWRSSLESLLVLYARRFPIRRGKLRVIDSVWRIAAGNQTTLRLAALKYGDLKVPCDLQEILQRQFYFFGTYFLEDLILRCWQKEAANAETIFDVGANAGIFSLAALAVQPHAVVHAFEPTPEIAARLQKTVELNRLNQLNVHGLAISNRNGRAVLNRFRGKFGGNEGMNAIAPDTDGPERERVQTVCLDQFCRDYLIDRVDLLKLDIQGHEHAALAGAENLLSTGRLGTIFIELNWETDATGICPAAESIRLLEHAGYQFSRPAARLAWREAGDWLRGLSDAVARRRPSPSQPGACTQ